MARKPSKAKIEYDRLRKNILAERRRMINKGFDIPEPTLSPNQLGINKPTSKEYKSLTSELKEYRTYMKESYSRQTESMNPKSVLDKHKSTKDTIDELLNLSKSEAYVPVRNVEVYNFKEKLSKAAFSDSAKAINKWANEALHDITDDELGQVLEEGEREGVVVDKYIKYLNQEIGFDFIGDMTKRLHTHGFISDSQAVSLLTNSSYISEENSNYFDDLREDMHI